MTTRGVRATIGGLVLAAGIGLISGCQTYLGGMTLPSATYLEDNPDYIPKQPQFPLPRELAAQRAAAKSLTEAVGTQP